MKDGFIECAGTGIRMERIIEISFVATPADLEMFAKKLRSLQTGDRTTVFTADGIFEGMPVRFIIRLKQ